MPLSARRFVTLAAYLWLAVRTIPTRGSFRVGQRTVRVEVARRRDRHDLPRRSFDASVSARAG